MGKYLRRVIIVSLNSTPDIFKLLLESIYI